jgi:membrane protein DedA with SNARE-associated domain
MHALAPWIAQHGYAALAIGALLEGETMLLLAGAAAHDGLLQWPWVVAIAALAGFAGDTLLFALGRWQSPRVFARWPMLATRVRPRIDGWLARHAGLTVVGVRFAYGLRVAGPLVLGTTSLRWPRFVAFNALGALAWAATFAGLGALLGEAALPVLHALERFGGELLPPLALLAAVFAVRVWQRSVDEPSSMAPPDRASEGRKGRPSGFP